MPPAGAVGVIVQVPGVNMVTVVPETVQTLVVELAKVTVVPAESLAVPREKVPAPPATLSQIGRDGCTGPSELTRQPIQFFAWKRCGDSIDRQG